MKKHITKFAVVLACVCALTARAVPTMTIFDGTTTITVTDNGTGDGSAIGGSIVVNTNIGNWLIVVNTGLTKPILQNPPHMDLNFSVTSTNASAASTLTITFSDDGFVYSGGIVNAIGGTTAGTVSQAVLKNGVAVAGTAMGPFPAGAYSGTTTGNVTLTAPDTLALQVVINHAAGVRTSSGDNELTRVPDGGMTVMLLGSSLVVLAFARRKLAA